MSSFKKQLLQGLFSLKYKNNCKLHQLNTLFWECTLRCNLNCRHCGSDCKKDSQQKDMPLEDFLRVIDEITPHVNPNKTLIILTGGEALMRDDIEKCGSYLYDKGFPWGFVSNGVLLSRKRLISLVEAGLRTATISLDGFEAVHNDMRQHPSSFQKAVSAIKLLAQTEGIVWDIVTCVTPNNFHQLKELKEYVISLGASGWRLFTIFPMGRASSNDKLQITDHQFVELMEFIKQTRKSGDINLSYGCEGYLGDYELEVRDNFFTCRAGINVASVLVDGSISGCASIRAKFNQGNIYKDSFMDIWNTKFEKYRNREWTKKGDCATCEKFKYCNGNGMHLYNDNEELMVCQYKRILNGRVTK